MHVSGGGVGGGYLRPGIFPVMLTPVLWHDAMSSLIFYLQGKGFFFLCSKSLNESFLVCGRSACSSTSAGEGRGKVSEGRRMSAVCLRADYIRFLDDA